MPFDELGFYALAGGAKDPRAIVDEIRVAEQLGLGTAFISKRFDVKEAATSLGCDAVILHGATPTELAPVVHEYASTQSTTITGDHI